MKDGRNTDLYLDLVVVRNRPKRPILMRYADKLHGMTHRDTALPGTWKFFKRGCHHYLYNTHRHKNNNKNIIRNVLNIG